MESNETSVQQAEQTRQHHLRLVEAQLEASAAYEKKLREQLAAAEEMTRVAIDTARDLGVSWRDIASISGLTDTQVQWRAHRDDPSAKAAAARRIIPAAEHKKRPSVRPGRGPGISVTDYARLKGVTRRTVYIWIEDGKLKSTKNEIGQIRVLSDEETSF
ncbi:hypothetical protein B5P43_15735 [Bacillus sp. SRB_336]|nr:hypothetical protein B5P43_15735 [Bacillus sp. SRB_336]